MRINTVLSFIKFNKCGTRHLNGLRHLFHLFCCTTQCIFEPLHVYEPGFNMDNYGAIIFVVVFIKKVLTQQVYIKFEAL